LRDYITSLGKGVTVMIYADHTTEKGKGDFQPARDDTAEYVPMFIYDTDRDLGALQKTRATGLALSGELKMIDISAYLRNQLANAFGTSPDSDTAKSGGAYSDATSSSDSTEKKN
jgi:hypothetical protein